jgi:hypothetical protein
MYYEKVLLNRFSPEIPLCSGRLIRSQSYVAPSHLGPGMKKVRDFIANFAKAGKGFTEIKEKTAYLPILAPADFVLLKKA